MTLAPRSKDIAVRGAGRTRMCALTRQVLPESDLVRFVAAPSGAIVPDIKAKLPGRGVWITLARPSVSEAARRNVFARGLKRTVQSTADLADAVAARLREAALGRLGLARRASAVVTGFTQVRAVLQRSAPACVLIATDAAEDSVRKMLQVLRRNEQPGAGIELFRCFSAEELGLAIGRSNVIHAAILRGPAGRSFVEAADRLRRYEDAGARGHNSSGQESAGRVND